MALLGVGTSSYVNFMGLHVLEVSGDQRWLERLGLKVEMAGGAEGGASQHVHGRLGRGIERSALPIEHSIGARSVDALTNLEKWELIREIAADVHRAASIAGAHRRIGHLAELLQSVAARCENDEARADNGRTVSDLMEAFIRVCDTLPVYDPLDAAACARATEKRQVAASFLRPGPGLWVPNEFSLRAAAVLGPEERRRR